MKIISIANNAEWHEVRAKHCDGSKAAALFGVLQARLVVFVGGKRLLRMVIDARSKTELTKFSRRPQLVALIS